jgi:alpha-tubulin suppressor-like RCC1 family protein
MRAPRPAVVLAALAGLGIGACGGSLYDEAGVPKVAGGNLCNPDTQHLCAATGAVCQSNADPDHCGAACDVCAAAPADGVRACLPGAGGVYACGFTCTAPARACGGQCLPQSVTACGASCAVCTAPANASPVCADQGGGAFGCDFACAAGLFKTATGCVRPTAVATGGNHTCAIAEGGALFCWGDNGSGQLGHAGAGGTTPALVLPSGVTLVAAGAQHTCAVQGGVVKCWGANGSGQLGRGTTGASDPTPAAVAGTLASVKQLAAGLGHTCALTTAGAVRCWGANGSGQVGIGTTSAPVTSPSAAPAIASGASVISTFGSTTCALLSGEVRCWGANGSGQTGKGGAVSAAEPTPVAVAGLPAAITPPLGLLGLAAGNAHTCVLVSGASGTKKDGLWCWGDDAFHELGDGGVAPSPALAPVQASVLDNQARLDGLLGAGASHTCASRALEVSFKCAGRNDDFQAGVALVPGPIADAADVTPGGALVAITGGGAHTCALVDLAVAPATGSLAIKCWGRNAEGQLGRITAGGAADGVPELAP